MKNSTTNGRQLLCCRNLALTAIIVLGLSAALAYADGPKNHLNVSGSAVFVFTPPVNITPLTGDLAGTVYGYDITDVKVGDDGTFFSVAYHTWDVTGKGIFYTRGEAVVSPTATPGVYDFSERQFFLPGGTGDFAGTLSGSLSFHGIIDLNVNGGSFDYHGVIFVNK